MSAQLESNITWKMLKENVEAVINEHGFGEDTTIYKIDLHEDRDDDNLGVFIRDGSIEILC